MGDIIGSDGGNSNLGSIIPNTTNTYNRELVLDLSLGSFSLYDMGHDDYPQLNDYVQVPDYYYAVESNVIINDQGDIIVLTNDDGTSTPTDVLVDRNIDSRKERVRYLTTIGTQWTLAEYKDYRFRDWVSWDDVGADFFSYLITGYELDADLMRNKYAPYLLVYCKRTEENYVLTGAGVVPDLPSSCIVQAQWDWTDSPATGKWSTKFQAYRLLRPLPSAPEDGDPFDYGERVIVTKNKLRGNGRALSLFIQSDEGKDMRLLGWGLLLNKMGEP